MRTRPLTAHGRKRDEAQYALRREGGFWELAFEGRQSPSKRGLGALYVAYPLPEPPEKPLHGVALALNARTMFGVVAVKLTCPTAPCDSTVLRASPPQNSAVPACRNFRIF